MLVGGRGGDNPLRQLVGGRRTQSAGNACGGARTAL